MNGLRIVCLCVSILAAAPLHAGVSVGFDLPALNELLPAMTLQEVFVPIAGGRTIRVLLDDLRILALEPSSGGAGADRILTSVNLRVPSLGLDVPLEPRMSLRVVEEQGRSSLELRFDEVGIPLPLAGSVDAAPFLTPLRFPADDLFLVAGARGDVVIHSRLQKIEMGLKVVRFDFDLDVVEPADGAAPADGP